MDAHSEVVVAADFGCERAAWVDNKGHLLTVLLHPALGKLMQVIFVGDKALRGEHRGAIFFGELGANFVLQIAGAYGAVEGPDVAREREVVAKERHLVLFCQLLFEWMSVGAAGTGEVFEDDDGDLASDGRFEGVEVAKFVRRAASEELGMGWKKA